MNKRAPSAVYGRVDDANAISKFELTIIILLPCPRERSFIYTKTRNYGGTPYTPKERNTKRMFWLLNFKTPKTSLL